MAAFPSINPARVRVRRLRAQSAAVSPFTKGRHVSDWGGRAWQIAIDLQGMSAADADVWGAFLAALQGTANTFTFDLDPHSPGVSPAPGVRTFKLLTPAAGWRSDTRTRWTGSAVALEDVFAAAGNLIVLVPITVVGIASAEAFGTPSVG